MLLRPAVALTLLLATPGSRAGEEDVAYFEKAYRTKITGVSAIEEYRYPDQFYTNIISDGNQRGADNGRHPGTKGSPVAEDAVRAGKTHVRSFSKGD